jgi:crotonobetainyl-CoA:carnitine CoA-transferase CaiB-like acyl-CoA transferase
LTSQIWSARRGSATGFFASYDSVDDERLGTGPGRLANRAEVIKIIEDWLQTFRDRDGLQCCN